MALATLDETLMTLADLLLPLHVIGAAVLLGTGAGIAFFMVMAVRTRDPEADCPCQRHGW